MKRQRKTEGGIMGMEHIREILRLQELGYAQREIHRATGVARSTIQEYLRTAKQHGLNYVRAGVLRDGELREILKKKTPGRKRSEVEEPDYGKVHSEYFSRKGVTLELLWTEWVAATGGGYSYSTFNRRYREWAKIKSVTLRHEYQGGEKVFVDYAGEKLSYWLGEVEHEAEIFVGALAASNKIFCEATDSQSLTNWLGSNTRMLNFYGGVPGAIVPDNLKSAVEKACRYEPLLCRAYEEWAKHYGTAIIPTRVQKPKDKGKVEKAVQDVERWVLAPLRHVRFSSLCELNTAIRERLEILNAKGMASYGGSSREELYLGIDKPLLRPLPKEPYVFSEWKKARVSLDYHIQFEDHYYSVPYRYVRKEVLLRIREKMVEIFHENELISAHPRSRIKYRFSTNPEHMPPAHRAVKSWTQGSFVSWAESVGNANSVNHCPPHSRNYCPPDSRN